MRIVAVIVVLLAAAWSGIWVFARSVIETQIETLRASVAAEGYRAEIDNLSVDGFPYRFKVNARGLDLGTQELDWHLPAMTVHALAYRPQHLLFDFPYQQRLTVLGQSLEIAAEPMRASLRFGFEKTVPFEDLRWQAESLAITSEYGWALRASHALIAGRLDPVQEAEGVTYDSYLRLRDLVLPEGLRQALDPEGVLPASLSEVALNGKLRLDQRLDATLAAPVGLEGVTLDDLHLQWGDLNVSAAAQLDVDYQGHLKGEVRVKVQNWQKALDLVERTGLLQGDRALMAERALSSLAQGDQVEIALPVRDNALYLGPLLVWKF